MKKLITVAFLLAAQVAFAGCDKTELIKESDLPQQSRTFLKTHFDGVKINQIIREKDGLEVDYTAYLDGGYEVDFVKSGAWDEVSSHLSAVPATLLSALPAGISTYVGANFADRQVRKVNRERYGYEIGLDGTGDFELLFDNSGNFLRIDD